jgi:hypothetical protein
VSFHLCFLIQSKKKLLACSKENIGAQLNIDSTCNAIGFFILKVKIPKALLLITQEGGKMRF